MDWRRYATSRLLFNLMLFVELFGILPMLQIPRVAKARSISEEKLQVIAHACIEKQQFGFLSAIRVNVLVLNLELDRL